MYSLYITKITHQFRRFLLVRPTNQPTVTVVAICQKTDGHACPGRYSYLAKGWTTEKWGLDFQLEQGTFLQIVKTSSGVHRASSYAGYRTHFPRGVDRPGREADHSPPSVPRIRMTGAIYFHSPIIIHGVPRGICTLHLYYVLELKE